MIIYIYIYLFIDDLVILILIFIESYIYIYVDHLVFSTHTCRNKHISTQLFGCIELPEFSQGHWAKLFAKLFSISIGQ